MAVIYSQVIASYKDDFTLVYLTDPAHPKMHKAHNDVTLVIKGPDGKKVEPYLRDAGITEALAAVSAAYIGGSPATAAEDAAKTALLRCLGVECSVDFRKNSYCASLASG